MNRLLVMMSIQVCVVGPTKPHPESIPPPLHLTLGSGAYCLILSCSWLIFNLVQVALRETFELLDNPECDKLGRQSWVVITIVVTELLICIKFG